MYFKQLFFSFFRKEKVFIFIGILILLNISLFIVYQQSLFSHDGYSQVYPNAGLEFFYYIHSIGITPYHFICMMLLLPNIVSCDFLTTYISHHHYSIETRISKKTYFLYIYFINFILTILVVSIFEIIILLIIHYFYSPIHFNTMVYPEMYYATTQLLFKNEFYNLIFFIILTSLGYGIVSTLLFSFQTFISNPYVYRCSGVLIGIFHILIPALINKALPIYSMAYLLQINNLICLGIEGFDEIPFQLSYWMIYLITFMIYTLCAWGSFQYMYKWRLKND